MYFDDGQIHIEEEDQCFSCKHFTRGVACPLLEALGQGVVSLDGDILVKNCGFYQPFKRHLRLIEPIDDLSAAVEAAGDGSDDDDSSDPKKNVQ